MRVLVPIIFLVMTLLFAPREGNENISGTAATEQAVVTTKLAEPAVERETEKYGELVESPGLLNSITLFGY